MREFPEKTPLSNFLLLTLEGIKMKDFDFFKMLINTYKTQLQRDQQFFEYVERIAKYYFDGATIKQENPMQKML